MGASSVTGVGQGSALKAGQKGAKHATLGVNNLIGPHVVAAGRVTLSSGAAVVHLPLLPGAATDYIVVTGNATTAPRKIFLYAGANDIKVVLTFSTDTVLTITGTSASSDVVMYAVVKIGIA